MSCLYITVVQLLSYVHSLWPYGLQQVRLPCLSLSLSVCSNSCPLSQWCHPTISFSVTLFSSCTQSFLAAISFPVSSFFTSSGQIIGGSASSSVLPMNSKSRFPLELTGYICWILMLIDSWMECKFRKISDWNGVLSFHMKLCSKRLKKSNELWVKVYLTGIFTIL